MEELPFEARSLAGELRTSLRPPRRSFWQPSTYFSSVLSKSRRQMLVTNDILRWLHHNWDLRGTLDDPPVRPGPQAKLQRLIWRTVRSSLNRYFADEHDLIANLVRMVDLLAKRIDDIEADDERVLGALRAELVDLAASIEERLERLGAGA